MHVAVHGGAGSTSEAPAERQRTLADAAAAASGADDRGGASATGEGEAIARFGLARRAVELLDTFGPREAADAAIAEFEAETGGRAGVLVLDHEGRVGAERNTAVMQTARESAD